MFGEGGRRGGRGVLERHWRGGRGRQVCGNQAHTLEASLLGSDGKGEGHMTGSGREGPERVEVTGVL